MSEFVKTKESSHWYTQDGEPAYEATLREARKENLVPSVTTINNVLERRKLVDWKIEQGILAAATLPHKEGESSDEWVKRVVKDSRETGRKAAEWGTTMHNMCEDYLLGNSVEDYKSHKDFWPAVKEYLDTRIAEPLYIEDSRVNLEFGYGGRTDLVARMSDDRIAIIDFKTTGTNPKYKVKGWPEWAYQLAGNYNLYPDVEIDTYINLAISSTEVGRVVEVKWSDEEIENGWEVFLSCLKIWRIQKKFPYVKKKWIVRNWY